MTPLVEFNSDRQHMACWTKGRSCARQALSVLRNLKLSLATLTLACMGPAHAFDNVTGFNTLYKGEIKSVQALHDGIEVMYARGNRVRLFNVNNPKNGSPVDYKYITYDAHLKAYVIDVWRVGKQTVLLSKTTGAAAEVGNVRKPSPNKDVIFSSDCLEMGCYYKLTQWPSGKRLAFSQASGTSGHYAQVNRAQAVELSTIRWTSNTQVAFEMPCELIGPTLYTAPAKLISQGGQWHLEPTNPCQ